MIENIYDAFVWLSSQYISALLLVLQPCYHCVFIFCGGQIVPLWVAPNLLTLSGFLMLVFNFVLMTYYDPHFYASSRDHPEFPPIPNWVWLVAAICNFLSHTLGEQQDVGC